MNTTNSALIIFTRNPELGKCKTRLAKTIGDEAALRIYIFLVEHTDKIARSLPDADLRVYFSDFIGEDNHYWHSNLFSKHLQHGEDLGVRMERAFTETFNAGYEKVVIIGSDLYDLGVSDLAAAFDALESHEAVLGPASDGGYYLLGLKKLYLHYLQVRPGAHPRFWKLPWKTWLKPLPTYLPKKMTSIGTKTLPEIRCLKA